MNVSDPKALSKAQTVEVRKLLAKLDNDQINEPAVFMANMAVRFGHNCKTLREMVGMPAMRRAS